MKRLFHLQLLCILLSSAVIAQTGKIDSVAFFTDPQPFEMTLKADFRTFMNKKMQQEYLPAAVTLRFADSTVIEEDIRIQARGKFRLANCFMPPILMNFKNAGSPRLRPLKKLKLVVGCASTPEDEQLIIKEYLAYKMYNLLTPKSFQVRLIKIRYEDIKGKMKSYSQYGFLLEDVDEMAARNKCYEVEKIQFLTESTDREQMTLIALFQFMIGNTDWSVPHYHNIKLMRHVGDSVSLPYAVPYDLNHCGLVNASYALPQEELQIKSVKERLYRGFPRSAEELNITIDIFKANKDKLLSMVQDCEWLNNKYKKETLNYLNEFFKILDNKSSVKYNFIDNARKQ